MLQAGIKTSGITLTLAVLAFVSAIPGISQTPAWQQETQAATWRARDSQAQLVYQNQMWILGGWFKSDEAPPRDIWRSRNGKDWELVNENAPWKHSDFPMAVVFKGRMWMMGGWYNGRLPGHEAGNELWSSADGINWRQEGKAPWSARLAGALVEFKGKLWLFGGTENYYFGDGSSLKNDIWVSEDGWSWTRVAASSAWSPRAYHQVIAHQGKLYLMGGGNYTPSYEARNDVWVSENGKDWKQLTERAPWHGRIWFTTAVYRGHIWILGGWSNNPSKNWDDAWYSRDGVNWTKYANGDTTWKERHAHATFVYRDKLWVAGGMTPPLVNDVWSLSLPKKWKP